MNFDEDEMDEEGDGESTEPEIAVEKIAVFRRSDYVVTDVAAVKCAGVEAYISANPDISQSDAVQDVATIGRAMYQIEHANGIESLNQTDGLHPFGSTSWIVEMDELLDDGPIDDWPKNPFEIDESVHESRLLYRTDETSNF